MGLQYRSKIDFAAILNSDKEGYALGVEHDIFLREEGARAVFNPPRIGVQGKSVGAITASTDISAGTDNAFRISVDGGVVVDVTLAVIGMTSGVLIAAELETKINAALVAANQDARVWVEFDSGTVSYKIYSQSTGTTSSVVITDAVLNNVADTLKIGVANAAVETAGTSDRDFFLYTTGGLTFSQPAESNPHRSGRFHVGVIRKKKVVNFDFDALINMSGNAGDSLDTPMRLLLKSGFGKETAIPGLSIKYEQASPTYYFSAVRVSTIEAEYYTGCYVKDTTLTIAGDAPGTWKFVGRGADASKAGIGKMAAGGINTTELTLVTSPYKHVQRFTDGARVMIVKPDGRTITHGYDGSLSVISVSLGQDKLTLSSLVDAEADGYVTYWHPGAVQTTGRDAVYTDLVGSMKLTPTGAPICATNITMTATNNATDKDNCFGTDTNAGKVEGGRLDMNLEVALDLSNDNLGELTQTRNFGGFNPELIVGEPSGRHLKITAPKWIPSVPEISMPENGTVNYTLAGMLYQSVPGAKDPFIVEFL